MRVQEAAFRLKHKKARAITASALSMQWSRPSYADAAGSSNPPFREGAGRGQPEARLGAFQEAPGTGMSWILALTRLLLSSAFRYSLVTPVT